MPELEGIITIKSKDGELIAIVFNDMKKKSQVFYTVKECGGEDIKQLLERIANKE